MINKNENEEVAIRLTNVKKMYKLGQIGGGTLQGDLQSWWARIRGKEDPNTKIGQEQRLVGQTFMALNGIDLTVYKGEALGIIGSNGAGKSTMLKLLSHVTAPTQGKIQLFGRVASMLEVGTGFNGQMTGRENIYMNGAILGMTKAEIDAKMEDIIEFSEVRDFIDTPVKRYSSGMYVKLAFSVAAHLDSEIMIMDEVLAVGDMAFQKKCLDKMRDAAKKEGRTVLYVSHNMNTIRQLCDRCIVLDKGKVVFEGDVEEAISIYMGNEDNEFKTQYSLSQLARHHGFGTVVKFTDLQFLNKEKAKYCNNESMNLQISVYANRPLDNCHIAFVIKNKINTDKIISGMSQNLDLAQGENQVIIQIPLNLLVSDVYMLHLEAIAFDYSGNSFTYDNPFTSFPFYVEDTNGIQIWPKIYYGNVKLDDVPTQFLKNPNEHK